jgi:transposase-like protein
MRNVLDELPQEQHAQVRTLMRAAYKQENAEEGMARIEKLARFIERQWPATAASRPQDASTNPLAPTICFERITS